MNEMLFRLEGVEVEGRLAVAELVLQHGVTAVVGPSGAGKTTLLNVLVGFEKVDRGRVTSTVCKVDTLPPSPLPSLLAGRRREVHTLPLFWAPAEGALWPHLSVAHHLKAVVPNAGEDASRIDGLLNMFELTNERDARPATLSAGQRERLAVARAVASGARVLVLDEPLIHVQPPLARRLWREVIDDVAGRGGSLIFSSHDPAVVLRHADRVVCLRDGRVTAEGDVRGLYLDPPGREVAAALGEGEWLEPHEAALWLGGEQVKPRILRPEHLDVLPDDASRIVVESSTDAGPVAQSRLMHPATGERRAFLHRPRFPPLAPGQRVTLRLLTLLILLLVIAAPALTLTACGSHAPGDGDDLGVQRVNHWPVPPDGPRVPAPRSVTLGGPGGRVTVLDNAGRILFYSPEGKYLDHWNMPANENGNAEGACWLADGRLAVADTHYHRVLFFDTTGKVVGSLGERGGGPGQFEFPCGITQDPAGNIYVVEYGGNDRIQKFTGDGEFIVGFGSVGTGPGEFQRASGVVWHEGRLYISDASNGRVQAFTDDGEFLNILGRNGEPLRLDFPYDLAKGADATLYAVEWGAGRVTRMTRDGRVLGRYGSRGTGIGQMRTPWGLAVEADGRVLVADTENRRIVELVR